MKKLNCATKKILSLLMVFVIVFSLSSVSVSAATIKKPTLKSVTAKSSSSIVVKWGKVKNAKGYVVYQKKGSNSFKKVATLKSGSKTTYTAKKLKSDTKYSYKIKAYTKKGRKTVYSAYSKVKYTRTKHAHKYVKYVCKCGKVDKTHAYEYLTNYLKKNGKVTGSYVSIFEYFDYTNGEEKIGLNYDANADVLYLSVLFVNDSGYSYSTLFYLDNYEYFCSVYPTGSRDYDQDYANGYVNAKSFTENTSIISTEHNETYFYLYELVEFARTDICNSLYWLEDFLAREDLGISIYDLGFKSF